MGFARNGIIDRAPPVGRETIVARRRRRRERLIEIGAESLSDTGLLEALLYADEPRRDPEGLAAALIHKFDGLAHVLSASREALRGAGVGLGGIVAIKSAQETASRLARAELRRGPIIGTDHKLIAYLRGCLGHSRVEEFHILFLDRRDYLLKHERQQTGTIDRMEVYPRQIIKRALEVEAAAMILVHNHPSEATRK